MLVYNSIQSNPVFIVKTQLTERSMITDKHRENHIKKHHEHREREKVMRPSRILTNNQDAALT